MDDIILTLKDVSLESEDFESLHNISFSLRKGDNIVFFGPENSGLDIIFPGILRFVDNFEGDILYKGESIREFDYIEIMNYRKDVGYLHTDHGLIANMSVEQNISLPLQYHSKMSSREIKEFVNSLISDLNLDYCKKFRPVDLTSSEILRTSYCRAIALDPDILLVEHAFERQSPLNIMSFYNSLKKRILSPHKSVLFITFEPEKFVGLADNYIMLFNGRVVFMGNSYDFLHSENEYLVQYKNMSVQGPMAIL